MAAKTRIRWRKTEWGWTCRFLGLYAVVRKRHVFPNLLPASWAIVMLGERLVDEPMHEYDSDKEARAACAARLQLLTRWRNGSQD